MRKIQFILTIGISLLLAMGLLAITGCKTTQNGKTRTALDEPVNVIDQEMEKAGAIFYRGARVDLSGYGKIILNPINIELHPAYRDQPIPVDDLRKIKIKYFMTFRKTINEKYPVVNQAGSSVLYMNISLLNIKTIKEEMQRKDDLNISLNIEDASMEAEFVDSLTGKLVATFVDPEAGKVLGETIILKSWDDFQKALDAWAVVVRDALDET